MITIPENTREACTLVLEYFGIFKYPLTADEVHRFCSFPSTPEEVKRELDELTALGRAFRLNGYYLARHEPGWLAERLAGNARAEALLKRTGRYARIIAAFPFVRGIAVSGSLSKHYASLNPDIDYFIITQADRLWIARSLLHLFKKLTFITGHQHFFCMNYFIDERQMTITHRNLYAAIETATLIPVYGRETFDDFFLANLWTADYLPNHPGPDEHGLMTRAGYGMGKRLLEGFIDLLWPVMLNRALMNVTDRKWRRKWGRRGYPAGEYDKAFLTSLHVSKNHPDDYEKKVLENLAGSLNGQRSAL